MCGSSRAPRSAIDFFTGGAVLLNAMGAHSIALEMMDAMQKSSQYVPAYFGGWCWTALLVLPHSVAVNYAFPQLIGNNGGCCHFQRLVSKLVSTHGNEQALIHQPLM